MSRRQRERRRNAKKAAASNAPPAAETPTHRPAGSFTSEHELTDEEFAEQNEIRAARNVLREDHPVVAMFGELVKAAAEHADKYPNDRDWAVGLVKTELKRMSAAAEGL